MPDGSNHLSARSARLDDGLESQVLEAVTCLALAREQPTPISLVGPS